MLQYRDELKGKARRLRQNMTDSEQRLWMRLRRKQVLGVPFYRQKPIGSYIVDFFSPRAKMVVEIDGSQHWTEREALRDKYRDEYLASLGLLVLRFDDREVLRETDGVMETILRRVSERLAQEIPPPPL